MFFVTDCEECHNLFKDQCDLQGGVGPSFVLDSPTATGVPQRALLTLPHGLMIGRSSIPGAGLGVMNQGPTVSPGMHFGPYEGEIVTEEEAVNSDYSWEVSVKTSASQAATLRRIQLDGVTLDKGICLLNGLTCRCIV